MCLYSQHFKGKFNVVPDSLSRDHHIPDHVLTQILFLYCPEQIPKDFHIYPVPQEIVSWLYKTLQLSAKPPQDPKELILSIIRAGLDRNCSWPASNSTTICSWILSQPSYDQESLSAMLKPLGMGSLQEEIKQVWLNTWFTRPWTKWQQSSKPTTVPTHSSQASTS